MADGVAVTPSTDSTKQIIDTDEVTRGLQTVQQQVVKISLGADNACDLLLDSGQQTKANSLPVAIASDQDALTIKGGGTAGTEDANVVTVQGIASMTPIQMDMRRMNGGAVATDNGASSSATQRVTIASDSTGQVKLAAGSATIGALTANQSVNVAQMNGVATTMGNGISGTGTQRVTLASDGTGQVAAVGKAAHDAAVSGAPVLAGGRASAAAPTDVSADGDAVNAWHLRNGAAATVLTAAGALIGGDATNGLDVDVTRLPTSSTGTRTQVNDTTTDSVILASNTNRKGAAIANDSSAALYLGLGTTTVTSTNYTIKIASGGYYEVPFNFTGQIRGLWATDPGDGGAKVTELT